MDREREHPDEGTIHAWLDGALDHGAARALEAHVADCRECAARVAEARGLIAGASRIVSALDDVPSTAGPAWGQAPAAASAVGPGPASRFLRITPARAAIAATVLVALGVSLTYERVSVESQASRAIAERVIAPPVEVAAPTSAAQARDPLLDSAVARNVAKAQPPRAVGPAPGPAVIVPAPAPATAIADNAAPARVAAGRAAIRAERELGTAAAPDQVAGRAAGMARKADDRAMAAAGRADTGVASAPAPIAASPSSVRVAASPECYRVESANGVAATWGADALPLVVRVDSAGRGTVLTVAGQATGSQAVVTRAGDDSLVLRLRRIGYEGTLALGASGDARAGVMRSRASNVELSQMVVTAAPAEEPAAQRRRATAKAAPRAITRDAPQAPATTEARSAASAAPAVPVVARRMACPG